MQSIRDSWVMTAGITSLLGIAGPALAAIICEKEFTCHYCEETGTAYDGNYIWTLEQGLGTLTPNQNTAHYECVGVETAKIKVEYYTSASSVTVNRKTLVCNSV